MSSTSTTLFLSFISILLVFSFLCFNPSSPILSSLISKTISSSIQVKAYDGDVDSNLLTRYDSASYVHDEVNDPGHVSGPGEVSNPVPTVNEEDVVVLTRNNFSKIASNTYAMVNFNVPWCYWSRKLEPDYSAAATMLKNTEAVLAKVDCTVEYNLCRDYKIQGYPSMVLFIRGIKKDVYYYERTRDAIATWMKQKMIPQVQTVESEEEVQDILSDKWTIVFGFLNGLEDAASEELAAVRKLHNDIEFYQTTNENIARLFGIDPEINRPALFWLQREQYRMNHTLYSFDGEFILSAISKFISVYKLPPVITFTIEKAPLVFNNPMKQLWLLTPKFSSEGAFTFKEAAMAFKGKLLLFKLKLAVMTWEDYFPINLVALKMSRGLWLTRILEAPRCIYILSFANQFLEDKLMDNKVDVKSDTLLKLPTRSDNTNPTIWPDVH